MSQLDHRQLYITDDYAFFKQLDASICKVKYKLILIFYNWGLKRKRRIRLFLMSALPISFGQYAIQDCLINAEDVGGWWGCECEESI